MNLQEELKALKERIAEVEEQIKREQPFPREDDEYWYANENGEVFRDEWGDFGYEKSMLTIGNVFQTENEAEFAVEKLKVEAELRKFSRPFKGEDNNYYIEIYLPDKKLSIDRSEFFKTQGTIYFESRKVANEAIDAVGADRIKKYLFGVEDL